MKPPHRFGITIMALLLVCVGSMVRAGDGDIPPKSPDDIPFVLIKTSDSKPDDAEQRWNVSIQIGKHPPIQLDELVTFGTEHWQRVGIVEQSIRVRRLIGKVNLYYIQWVDHAQGQGNYQSRYYHIVDADDPAKVFASGSVPLSGRWGMGTGHSGSCEITYRDEQLSIVTTSTTWDTAMAKQPLYHAVAADKGDFFQMRKSERLTRTFEINEQSATLRDATLAYQIQQGDTLVDIITGLKIQEDWLINTPTPLTAGQWILAALPPDDAAKRYPTITNPDAK